MSRAAGKSLKTKFFDNFNVELSVTRSDITEIILAALGFFTGRVVVFGTVNPVGIAFIAPFFLKGKAFYISCLFTLLGMLTRYNHYYTLKYFICAGVLLALHSGFSKKVRRIGEYIQVAIVSLVLLFSGIVVAIINNGSVYLGVVALLEGVLAFTFGIILSRAMVCVKGRGGVLRKFLTNEELISVAILVGAVIAGGSDIFIGVFSFRYFFCFCVVMLMSNAGSGAGAAGGLLLGALIHISGYEPVEFTVILSMSGLVSGSLKNMGKPFSACGFLIGAVISGAYFKYPITSLEHMASFLAASGMFLFTKTDFLTALPQLTNPINATQGEEYIKKARLIVTERLDGYAESFLKLSRSFGKLSERKTSLNKQDAANIIDDTAARVCCECKKCDKCWDKKFYNTYETVYLMLSACEKKGKITDADITPLFKEQCLDAEYFAATLNRCFELYRTNLVWRNKIAESRKLVSEQIEGVSKIIKTLSGELSAELNFKDDLEKKIIAEFEKNSIEVDGVIVLENMNGLYEVTISHKPCYGQKVCDKRMLPLINNVLNERGGRNRRIRRQDELDNCSVASARGKCSVRFTEEQRFVVSCGISHAAKDSVSGDSYSFMEYRNGQCMLALSDGMGSGERAKKESSAAIELLEQFMETGFDQNTAVKLINSVLLLRSSDEIFSTLDICSVNLHNGAAEFIKIGASSTFLIRDGEVDVIKSWSLPAGIVDTVDADVSRRNLKDNDIIVMVTDGILDSDLHGSDKEKWVVSILEGFGGKNPQDIADFILSEAKKNYDYAEGDDMTVLTAKIWEKL